MIFQRPKLASIDRPHIRIQELKTSNVILFIDDKSPGIVENLRGLSFNVKRFSDIEDVEQVQNFPIIACDIEGIGKSFSKNTDLGGYKVLREIRKYYPDKYLIQYSTKTQDMDPTLAHADEIFPKDTPAEVWQAKLEEALKVFCNPKSRWIRIRNDLSQKGLDGYDIYKLEQAYIKSICKDDPKILEEQGRNLNLPPDVVDIIIKLSLTISTIMTGAIN